MATATTSVSPLTGSEPRMRVVYCTGGGEHHLEWPAERIAEALADDQGTVWLDIEDLGSNGAGVEPLLREVFGFHPLAIDDALHESHVSKVDNWDRYLYMVFHAVDFDPRSFDLGLHELDIFLGPNYLVTYHHVPIRLLEQVRENIHRDNGDRLRRGPDHLLYLILDALVADYLPAIESLDEAIDDAQDEVFTAPTPKTMHEIFQIKRAALRLHRTLIPQREVLNRLARDSYGPIDPQDRVYFRDVYDHTVRLHDISETLRDLISGALDTYLSAISNRTNEVMKALTIVTVMFLPLNFLVGFFGMNFFADTLAFKTPQLPNTLLFWLTCLILVVAPIGIAIWARRRGWFTNGKFTEEITETTERRR